MTDGNFDRQVRPVANGLEITTIFTEVLDSEEYFRKLRQMDETIEAKQKEIDTFKDLLKLFKSEEDHMKALEDARVAEMDKLVKSTNGN